MKKLIILLLTLSSSAFGVQVNLSYSGLITDNGGSGEISVGDRYFVEIFLPDGAPDTSPGDDSSSFRYNGDFDGFSAIYSVIDLDFSVPVTQYLDLFIVDQPAFGSNQDRFEFEAFIEDDTGAFFNFFLVDNTRTALENGAFPNDLVLSDFSAIGSNLFASSVTLRGDVDTLSYSIVPEPSFAALIGGLCAFIAVLSRMRTRRLSQ